MKISEKEISGVKEYCLTLTEGQFIEFLKILKDYVYNIENYTKIKN